MKWLPLVRMLLIGASLFGTTASAMAQPRIGACAADRGSIVPISSREKAASVLASKSISMIFPMLVR
jgi:hypothetical protein